MPFKKGQGKIGGRTKGVKNRSSDEIKLLLNKTVDFKKVIGKLFELSQGVQVQRFEKGMPVVYSDKPDSYAAKILLEYGFGKPVQPFEGEFEGDITVKFVDA